MIKLSKPYIPEAAYEAMVEVLRSGNLVQGEYVLKFENALKEYLGAQHVIVVSSGTAALHLSLIALGIGPGDEVIVPAFTFPATANVVELVGAKPVFADILPEDFCIDTAKAESLITAKTKAILPVHEFGQAAKIDDLLDLAGKYNLFIIEDAACALGAEFNGRKAGTFGNAGCYSFHPRKAVTTGEGGAIATNDDQLAAQVRSLRNHGIRIENGKTDFYYAGLNYRLTDFQAVLGYFQLAEIESLIDRRILIAEMYDKEFEGTPLLTRPAQLAGRKHVYQSYHILLDPSVSRDEIKTRLLGAGIETNYGANALAALSYYKAKYGLQETMFPNSLSSYLHGLALPLSHYLTEEDILTVSNHLKSLLKHDT